MLPESAICCLSDAVQTSQSKVLNLQQLDRYGKLAAERPVLVILAAGKGTRFGQSPKCAQLVCGVPLARHSMNAFRSLHASPVICIVGYRYEEVVQTLGDDNVYVRSDNPAGGTAFAAFESFSVPGLDEANPVLIVTMGDRIVTASVFRQLYETHLLDREADLTLLTALYEPPRNHGKGRVLRDAGGHVVGIIEQRDIDLHPDRIESQRLAEITEGNCPLYAVRAATLRRYLARCTNDNAQGQYYFTDIVRAIAGEGGEIRTITTSVAQPEYDLLCSDVTRPMDLALLEGILTSSALASAEMVRTDRAAESILAGTAAGAGRLHCRTTRRAPPDGAAGEVVLPTGSAGRHWDIWGASTRRVHASRHGPILRSRLANALRRRRCSGPRADRGARAERRGRQDPALSHRSSVPREVEFRVGRQRLHVSG